MRHEKYTRFTSQVQASLMEILIEECGGRRREGSRSSTKGNRGRGLHNKLNGSRGVRRRGGYKPPFPLVPHLNTLPIFPVHNPCPPPLSTPTPLPPRCSCCCYHTLESQGASGHIPTELLRVKEVLQHGGHLGQGVSKDDGGVVHRGWEDHLAIAVNEHGLGGVVGACQENGGGEVECSGGGGGDGGGKGGGG